MSIKIRETSLIIRGYNDTVNTDVPACKLCGTPYDFVCTVQIIDDVAYIIGGLGKLSLSNRKDIGKQLKEKYHIKEAIWNRKGIIKNKKALVI